ncbi:MAG: nucleotidyltransferase domain-containing protein [Gemmatimonadetes bacterium]|nr:nucleotidyltransferase domain-containing protein [Gemmatimonadota bacterium]
MQPAEHHGLRVKSAAEIRDVLQRLRSELEQLYGERLRAVYLFGSYSRHEADAESDMDVLIVLDDIKSYSDEIERTGHLAAELSLDAEVSISRTFVSAKDWAFNDSPFLTTVRREAIGI